MESPGVVNEELEHTSGVRSGEGSLVRLDAETSRVLGVPVEESATLIEYVCERLAELIRKDLLVDVLGFGSFRVKLYRPIRPARMGDDSFVEAPYLGPVEFSPGALLLRQLRTQRLEPSVVPRCDALYSMLRKDNRIRRGRIPLLIKGTFKSFTAALIEENLVELPAIGCLVVRNRPPVVRYNLETRAVEVLPGDPALFLRLSSRFLAKIPARSVPTGGECDEST